MLLRGGKTTEKENSRRKTMSRSSHVVTDIILDIIKPIVFQYYRGK